MIDLHSHLLPGVDDGSPSIEASLPVLEEFVMDGIDFVVCTPHLEASRARAAPFEFHTEILDELRRAAPPAIRLELGWEIMLDVPGADLRAPELGLAGSNAVLVEFPRAGIPPNSAEELFRLRMSGVVPVLAHPERYIGLTMDHVVAWKRAGAVMQLDVQALAGKGRTQLAALEMLNAGLIDVFSSDNHGDTRSLGMGRRWLTEHATDEHVALLTRVNAERLLAGESPFPVPPLPRRRRRKVGFLGRLRDLVLGAGD